MKKLILFTSIITTLFTSCSNKEIKSELNKEKDSINLVKKEIKEPRKFTLTELKDLVSLDSLSLRNELKKIGFIPVDEKSNLVFVDSLYLDKVKDEKIGYGYYMLLKSPVITCNEDIKQVSISFPSNQLSYYMQSLNENIKDSHKIESNNLFYERNNIYIPQIRFIPFRYSLHSSYEIMTYEDYSNLYISVNTL
ncbi:hypothetical protein [Chishuiella changwenlii]|uniref:hypothetical protein n=1 Tax=Chishuiella changwenlii TaxID=1434701 RepID=UPI002FD9F043